MARPRDTRTTHSVNLKILDSTKKRFDEIDSLLNQLKQKRLNRTEFSMQAIEDATQDYFNELVKQVAAQQIERDMMNEDVQAFELGRLHGSQFALTVGSDELDRMAHTQEQLNDDKKSRLSLHERLAIWASGDKKIDVHRFYAQTVKTPDFITSEYVNGFIESIMTMRAKIKKGL